LDPGYQLAQSCHAAIQFNKEHEDLGNQWYYNSNYIVTLSVADEAGLLKLIRAAEEKDLKFSIFFEPDLQYAITAIALQPSPISKRLCSKLKLALKEST
jgi:peptidyl-tRNA hydrolase